ncbi:hypothetical protein Tco_0568714 [Tanacetum coccineum]
MVVRFWLWLGFGCGWVPVVEGRGGGDFDGGGDVGGGVVVVVVNGGFQPERLARGLESVSKLKSKIRRIDLVSFVVFCECMHGYAVSSLMDTAYWLSE